MVSVTTGINNGVNGGEAEDRREFMECFRYLGGLYPIKVDPDA
jgi:hypothetical protein